MDSVARQRLAPRLLTPSGGLLALCFVLPTVQVCGRPVAPYEAAGVFPPYLFGLLVALIGVLVGRRRPVPPLLCWVVWLLATGGGAALTVGLVVQLREPQAPHRPAVTAALACVALGLTLGLVALLRRGVAAGQRLARTLMLGGALSLLWCLLILSSESRRNLLVGFWLTLASSLGVATAGLLLREPEGIGIKEGEGVPPPGQGPAAPAPRRR